MNRWNARIWIGAGLVVLGLLMLLERVGLFRGVADLFWGLIFLAGAAFFFYRFLTNGRSEWWAAIPGFALLGIAGTILLSNILPQWSGFWFLAALGMGFVTVYLFRREFWWAIIPGGVLITLAFVAVLGDAFGGNTSPGVLFLGFGLTFILVALLAGLQWAWIPGIILVVMGAVFGLAFTGAASLVWPAALIVGGLLLIFQFVRKK
jgi:hypothetical protein